MPSYIGYRPQFNPVSLQDYLAVPTMILGEYGKAEDTYNETANKAEALKALLGERNADNEVGWQIVDKYESLVKDAADAMAATGIQGPEGYRQAKKAGTYYRQNMLPLESGLNALQTDEKELRARDKDGTLVRKRRYSLNDYIKNPNLRSDSVLGSSIQTEAMKAAATASARRKSEPLWGKAGGNQYHSITTTTGFSPEEVQNWLADRSSSPELNEIYNGIAKKFVEAGYNINDIDDYITRGIYDGIAYDNKVEYQKNLAYETPAQRAAREAQTFSYADLLDKEEDVMFPSTNRPASFGRTDLENKVGNFVVINQDGSLSAKKGDDLLDAFGIPKSEQRYSFTDSAGQKHYKEHKFTQEERIAKLFDNNGRLNTTYIKNNQITGSKEKKLYIDQLKEFGFDFNQSFNSPDKDIIITEGSFTKPVQRLETIKGNSNKQRFTNLENALQNLYQTSPEGISNSTYTVIPTKFPVNTLEDLIGKTNYNDWTRFEGMERTEEDNLNPKGKKVNKDKVVTEFNLAKGSGKNPTMDLIPGSNYAILDLHDDDNQQFIIPLNRLDPDNYQKYTYTREELKAIDEDLQQKEAYYQQTNMEYNANPTQTNYYRKEYAAKLLLEARYKKNHLGDVYVGGLTNSRVNAMNARNINTEKFGEELSGVVNKVTR